MVDALEKEGIRAFGPRANAAIIESSKVFSKNLMKKYDIPTADYAVFSDPKEVVEYVEKRGKFPVVIKADGLARALSSRKTLTRRRMPCTPLWKTRCSALPATTLLWRNS